MLSTYLTLYSINHISVLSPGAWADQRSQQGDVLVDYSYNTIVTAAFIHLLQMI